MTKATRSTGDVLGNALAVSATLEDFLKELAEVCTSEQVGEAKGFDLELTQLYAVTIEATVARMSASVGRAEKLVGVLKQIVTPEQPKVNAPPAKKLAPAKVESDVAKLASKLEGLGVSIPDEIKAQLEGLAKVKAEREASVPIPVAPEEDEHGEPLDTVNPKVEAALDAKLAQILGEG